MWKKISSPRLFEIQTSFELETKAKWPFLSSPTLIRPRKRVTNILNPNNILPEE
jgi:hypothetical protein